MTPSPPDSAGTPVEGRLGEVPVLPTRELVVFPKMVTPLYVGREKSIKAVEQAFAAKAPIVLSSQRAPYSDEPAFADLMPVGTQAKILQLFKLPDGAIKALVEGRQRVRLESVVATAPHLTVVATPVLAADRSYARSRVLVRRVSNEFALYARLHPHINEELEHVVAQLDDPEEVADVVATHLLVSTETKQELLATESTRARLTALLEVLIEETAVLDIEQEIMGRVHERIEKHQRQIVLQEKLRVVRDQIAEANDEGDDDIAEYRRRAAEAQLSPTAEKLAERELRKLRQLPAMSPEVAVVRGLLDTLLDLSWGRVAGGEIDMARVAAQLGRTHFGLADIKDRILEYIAVCTLRASRADESTGGRQTADQRRQPATILCLAGPPGTGKSSIAESIAAALGRPFVRVALGGVRDESEIRGHRRTYVGAMPGRIVDGLIRAGADDPVLLLDEIDKLDSDWRGNPAAALMEVLDPAHNRAFRDNYLECEYDLSRIFFVATANDADAIPATLYDRLEVLHLGGYTEAEKLAIARRHLLPRSLAAAGLRRGDVKFERGVLAAIVRGYTREAGVRELERALQRVTRKVVRRHLEGGCELPARVTNDDLRGYLGEAVWLDEVLCRETRVGEALGLAYTAEGGEVLTIEAAIVRGRGELVLTGQLGEVMQESASAAWGHVLGSIEHDSDLAHWLRRSPYRGKDGLDVATQDVRVHVPEGAVPKDGPSAGLALAVAMFSALTRAPLRPRVALTGEITLGGRVLRVGGLKEKLLAAGRSGVRTVILPAGNRATIAELPAEVTGQLALIYVENFKEALDAAVAKRSSRCSR